MEGGKCPGDVSFEGQREEWCLWGTPLYSAWVHFITCLVMWTMDTILNCHNEKWKLQNNHWFLTRQHPEGLSQWVVQHLQCSLVWSSRYSHVADPLVRKARRHRGGWQSYTSHWLISCAVCWSLLKCEDSTAYDSQLSGIQVEIYRATASKCVQSLKKKNSSIPGRHANNILEGMFARLIDNKKEKGTE